MSSMRWPSCWKSHTHLVFCEALGIAGTLGHLLSACPGSGLELAACSVATVVAWFPDTVTCDNTGSDQSLLVQWVCVWGVLS